MKIRFAVEMADDSLFTADNLLGISSSVGFPWFISSVGNECLVDHVALCVNRRSDFAFISLSLIYTFYLTDKIKCNRSFWERLSVLLVLVKEIGYSLGARQIAL